MNRPSEPSRSAPSTRNATPTRAAEIARSMMTVASSVLGSPTPSRVAMAPALSDRITAVTSCGWHIEPRKVEPIAPASPSTSPPARPITMPWLKKGASGPEKMITENEIVPTTDKGAMMRAATTSRKAPVVRALLSGKVRVVMTAFPTGPKGPAQMGDNLESNLVPSSPPQPHPRMADCTFWTSPSRAAPCQAEAWCAYAASAASARSIPGMAILGPAASACDLSVRNRAAASWPPAASAMEIARAMKNSDQGIGSSTGQADSRPAWRRTSPQLLTLTLASIA